MNQDREGSDCEAGPTRSHLQTDALDTGCKSEVGRIDGVLDFGAASSRPETAINAAFVFRTIVLRPTTSFVGRCIRTAGTSQGMASRFVMNAMSDSTLPSMVRHMSLPINAEGGDSLDDALIYFDCLIRSANTQGMITTSSTT